MPKTSGVSQPFAGFSSPNYTQVPDELFDELMPLLSDSELRIALYIIRRTFGFKKGSDTISLRQMVDGITTINGRVLDRGAGLSKASAARAVKGLVEKGIILKQKTRTSERGDEANTYALHLRVAPVSQFETPPPVSKRDTPVSQIETHKKQTKQETEHSKFRKASPEKKRQDDEPGTPARASAMATDAPVPPKEGSRPSEAATPPLRDPALTTTLSDPPSPASAEVGYQRFRAVALGLREERKQQPDHRPRRGASQPTAIGELLPAHAAPVHQPPSVEAVPTMPPASVEALPSQRGRPPGSREEREHLAAYLTDFSRQLGDQAPLSSTVTRAWRLFQQANVAPPLWGDFLYQARSITQEHSGQIKTNVPTSGGALSFAPKPKMAYFFAVLRDLLGLKDDPDRPSPASRAGFVPEDKRSSLPTRLVLASESDRVNHAP